MEDLVKLALLKFLSKNKRLPNDKEMAQIAYEVATSLGMIKKDKHNQTIKFKD